MDLCDALKEKQSINVPYIVHQLLTVLQYIHGFGLIHGDIKPSNILIYDECRVVKLCNFGCAQKVNEKYEPPSEIHPESLLYCAPEILSGKHEITTAVDIWSLGCLIVQMLSGQTIFCGTDNDVLKG